MLTSQHLREQSRRFGHGALRALGLAVALCASGTALAGEERPWSKDVPQARQDAALRLYQQGNEHFDRQQYARALKAYREAVATLYRLDPEEVSGRLVFLDAGIVRELP